MTNQTSTRSRARLALSPVLIAALFGACGGDGVGGIQEPRAAATVTITAPTTTIRMWETVQLTATARDADGAELEDKSFEWTSGITTVATVSPSGLVAGRGKGRSRIRATTEGVTGSIVITVELGERPD